MYVNNCIIKNNFTVNLEQIEQKVLNIQKKIYNASKKCDINKVHEIQTNFLKHQDYQFLFVKLILKQISKKNFLISNYNWKIIIYLYICINIKKTSYIIVNFIKEKVQQYVVFLLLQPEWKARCENLLYMRQKKIYSKKLKTKIESIFKNFQKIHKSINEAYVDIDISIKSINNKYLINKINSIKSVSNQLNLWLNSQNLFDYNNKKAQKKFIHYYHNENSLDKLLENILCIGIEWHIYINLKTKKIYQRFILFNEKKLFFINYTNISNLDICIAMFMKKLHIDINVVKYRSQKVFDHKINFTDIEILIKSNNSFRINPSSNSIKFLLSDIRSILYHKNRVGQWRLNTYLSSTQAKLAIKKILFSWYKYYYYILDSTKISKINTATDKIFYIWQIKK